MSHPIAICLERFSKPEGSPFFTSCVALPTGEMGLGLTAEGAISWKQGDEHMVTLSVAEAGGLFLHRPAHGPTVQVHRSGRTRDLGEDEAVEVLQGDRIVLDGEHEILLHLHGNAPAIAPPTLVEIEQPKPTTRVGAALSKVAAAAAIGAAGVLGAGAGCDLAGCESTRDTPVRPEPPIVAEPPDLRPLPPEPPPAADAGIEAGGGGDASPQTDESATEEPAQEPTGAPTPPAEAPSGSENP